MYFVYILFSKKINQYYCGQTNNMVFRLQQHNAGDTVSNKHGAPWELIGYLVMGSRSAAVIKEKQIKQRRISRWLNEHKDEMISQAIDI